MLKKSEQGRVITKLTEPQVRVIDIASEEGQAEMIRIYTLLGDPAQGLVGSEQMLKTVLDPKAPRGFRTLVLMKWWRPIQDLKPKTPIYESTDTTKSAIETIKDVVVEMKSTAPQPPSGEQQLLS